MHVVELAGPGLDRLHRAEVPDPAAPGKGEVLLRMRAASFNFIDLAVAKGFFHGTHYPLIPVADGAGEVVAIGPAVRHLGIGDRVAVHPKAAWIAGRGDAEQQAGVMRGVTLPGSLTEFASVEATTVAKAPDHLDWEQIAALPICATTAWNALKSAGIGPASTVILLGTGGVSIAALQLAKAAAARVILTSSSDEKLELARSLGADATINYRQNPEWDEAVRALTNGAGADLVVETGGAGTFVRSLKAVRQGGTVFTVGFVTGSKLEIDLMDVIIKGARIVGNNTGSVADLAEAMAIVGVHKIGPVIAQVYGLDEIRQAYEALSGGGHFGKLAIRLDWE